MLSRWSANIRQQRGWLTLSCSVLPFVLALVGMELFKMATFPQSFLQERQHDAPPAIRAAGGIEFQHARKEFETPGSRWDVMDCINQNQESYRSTTWASAMSHRPAPLMVAGIWWSAKPASVPLTVTTQLSAARLWQLKALCMQYPGPVSAVLYVGLIKGRVLREDGLLAFMVSQAEALFHAMERSGQCKLDLMLVREVFDEPDAKIWYPVNQLRNYARLQARTPLIAIVDADLLVSPVLVEELQALAKRKQYLRSLVERREKSVYVLPAFQVPNSVPREEAMTLADRAINLNKAGLREWYEKDYVVPFDPGKPGHAATNYSKWFVTSQAYEVKYELRYEPWVMCDRRSVPWHDNTFKGYGLNKIMHLEHMSSMGYRFMVHPSAFLVHRAHRSTKAKRLVLNAKQAQKAAAPLGFGAADVPEEAREEDEDEEEEEEDARGQGLTDGREQAGDALSQMLSRGGGLADGVAGEQRRKLMGHGQGGGRQGKAQSVQGRDIDIGQVVGQGVEDGELSQGQHQHGGEQTDWESDEGLQAGVGAAGGVQGEDEQQQGRSQHLGRALLSASELEADGVWAEVQPGKQAKRNILRTVHHGGVSTYSHTQKLGDEARRRIAAGTYEPRTDKALQACLERLPWWRKA